VWSELDRLEQLSVVCEYVCKGLRLSDVAKKISVEYSTSLSRESTYPMLTEAALKGWLRYVPPPENLLTQRIKQQYSWLRETMVVHTCQFEDVAYHGAEMLITLLKHMKSPTKKTIHIGFSGGHAMRRLAQILAKLLSESDADLPEKLVLHALVAGFEVLEPTTDPNTFFTLFHTEAVLGPKCEFVGLHAPTVVKASQYKGLRSLQGIKESFDQVDKLDIIVTSAANWADEHSTFRKRMRTSPACFKMLDEANCVGDMLWLPLGPDGPLTVNTKIRAMTLVELAQLPGFINDGKHVVLVLGPCAGCQKTKADTLRAVLASKDRLISHLVVDSRSARELLQ
jgi:DNA-binding transcriptional regulator LsrR (DeoR family)